MRRFRLPCSACETKLDVPEELKNVINKQICPDGDLVTLVCNAKCEEEIYQQARYINYLLYGEQVAYHSDAIVRHDLFLKGGFRIVDGKVRYGA